MTDLLPATRHATIELRDGRTLAFDDIGGPAASPILYFHGFGSSRLIRHPDDTIATRVGARVIAVDRPGIGHSSPRPERRLLDWPEDVRELVDALGLDRFAVLGWSGGGPYALACARALPDRVSVVGLVSGAAPLAGVGRVDYLYRTHRAAAMAADSAPWIIRLAMWRWARAQQRDPERDLDQAVAKMVEADQALLADPTVRATMLANVEEMHRHGGRGIYDEALTMARPWGFRVSEVTTPVWLWHGEEDPSVPVAMGRYLAAQLPSCEANFYPGEGHHLLFDRWEQILGQLVP
ncbi:MAG: alpha/beta hydrolase [Candidatus Limnocylindrales bacterium]